MFERTTGTQPMPLHTTSIKITLMVPMRCSFFENLMNCRHKNDGIRDFFHNHDHVLIHVHEFGTILHSLQGMVQIQLDETGDFSSKTFFKTFIEMMTKENQCFCAILQGCLIFLFDHNSKIHCIKMYFNIKDPR